MITSAYSVGHLQCDGRRYVREQHTDAAGTVHTFEYLAAPGTDYSAVLAQHAAELDDRLAEQEATEVLDG